MKKNLKIGLIFEGDEKEYIWGSAITTYYLGEALKRLGHEVWRASVTDPANCQKVDYKNTDLIISEGAAKWLIPEEVWDSAHKKIFWWLADLYYDGTGILSSGYDAIAVNSSSGHELLKKNNIPCERIDLCAAIEMAQSPIKTDLYHNHCVYLGCHPHKTEEQMSLMFEPAQKHNFGLWGKGWEDTIYKQYHRGVLPLGEIGSLYRSSKATFLLTELRQQSRGMINNRVYEVLICGSIPISETFSHLENSDLGEFIHFASDQAAVEQILERSHSDQTMKDLAVKAIDYVKEHHTYSSRAQSFMKLWQDIV